MISFIFLEIKDFMNNLCAIVSGGQFSELNSIENADFIIACDKGYEYLLRSNLSPDLFIGDFDSYLGDVPENIARIVLPKQKDDTDTMVSIKYAVSHGFKKIFMYCALGGRLDHTIANIQASIWAAKRIEYVKFLSEEEDIYVISNSKIKIPKKDGYSLSVFSASDVCKNVNIKNTKYVLNNAVIDNSFPIGISNEWIGDAEISVGSGVLLIILSKIERKNNGYC